MAEKKHMFEDNKDVLDILTDQDSSTDELEKLAVNGYSSAVRVDTTGDGYPDTIFIDEDGNGEPDLMLVDTNCDGNFDTTVRLTNGAADTDKPEDDE